VTELKRIVVTCVTGSFSNHNGVDECIERVAESINYAHSRVDKIVTGFCNVFRVLIAVKLFALLSFPRLFLKNSKHSC